MCGRYNFSADSGELWDIIKQIKAEVKTGEIYPTNPAAVLGADLRPEAMLWGFPDFRGSGVIINARAETAQEKRTFADSVINRRCVIPSSGFYEWDKEKQKYLFTLPGEETLYMGGLWREYNGEMRFVILTTAPNNSILDIHNRMPLVLPKTIINDWVSDTDKALNILHDTPPLLERMQV